MTAPASCPDCGGATICPRCIGRRGGQARSKKQTRARRRNIAKTPNVKMARAPKETP